MDQRTLLGDSVRPMPRTREQLDQAARDAEAWLDSLDPAESLAEDPRDLRRIGLAVKDVATAERELADAVAAARQAGAELGEIALALGVSKQAALQRYGDRTRAS